MVKLESDINAREEIIEILDDICVTFYHMDKITHLYLQNREIYEPKKDYTNFVKAAIVEIGGNSYKLYTDYTHQELEHFLISLNIMYFNGYGEQELFGYIWLEDGTWLNRYGYDGLEYWSHIECPSIPVRP